MTPHISAKKEDIAKVVLMPGDPLRAKYIAENFLENYVCVNEVRGMLAFTGYYQGKRITVMAHGMGIPSIGIYSYELFKFYDVDTIIRIGSCGAYRQEAELGDIIIASKVVSWSTYPQTIGLKVTNNTLLATKEIVDLVKETATTLNIPVTEGMALSSDAFYADGTEYKAWIQNLIDNEGLLAAEMEGYGLYANAQITNKKALTILSVSDSIVDHNKKLSPEERVSTFRNMMKLALESAIKLI